MTEKLRIDETQLSPELLKSRCFHLICTPSRCVSLVRGILARRQELLEGRTESTPSPNFVWEPVPDSMGPEAMEDLLDALQYVDVVSPNHQELAALFEDTSISSNIDDSAMRTQCSKLIRKNLKNRDCAVVVRCGERGCYVATSEGTSMMPAYHRDASRVVDPTGAGNAFLGGFCIGMLETPPNGRSIFECGAVFGSVASSFAVEQVGLPRLTSLESGRERWNGENVEERLRTYWSMANGI
jgi:sugar/nucleoside kinase (ribokinase family)